LFITSISSYSIIKNTADDLANYLQLQHFDAASYHAGKSPSERKRIQNLFINDKLNIVVATVAFGMGIDKRNVRAVIHFNLPRSLENYVQVTL
jgi:superfamily II DNA helicase RecQ